MIIKEDRGGVALAVSNIIHILCDQVNQPNKVLSNDVNVYVLRDDSCEQTHDPLYFTGV